MALFVNCIYFLFFKIHTLPHVHVLIKHKLSVLGEKSEWENSRFWVALAPSISVVCTSMLEAGLYVATTPTMSFW